MAVIRTPPTGLERLVLPAVPLVVVAESVEKPGNLGAILRSADGAGADALIAADPRTDVFNPNAIRASLGTIFALPIAVATTAATIAWLQAATIAIVVARVDGSIPYSEVDLSGSIAIVLGSEAHGLADAWSGADVRAVRLPMLGIADSLNVSGGGGDPALRGAPPAGPRLGPTGRATPPEGHHGRRSGPAWAGWSPAARPPRPARQGLRPAGRR